MADPVVADYGRQSIFRPDLFAGRAAIVTGGGTGLGLAITRELLSLGCNVTIVSRSAAKLDKAVAELRGDGACVGKVHSLPCNIRSEEDVRSAVAGALAHFGRLDYLVNNGGGQFIAAASEMSGNGFRAVVETNLVGTFLACREAYTQAMQEHGGAIVNITMVNRNGFPRMAHSGAARAGVLNLTRSLATEWAAFGVRINCVAPGVIYTPSGFENYGPMGEVFLNAITPAIPFKRLGTAEEVASGVVWLLSDGAAYVSGQEVSIDGGSSLVGYPYPLADTGATSRFPVYGDAAILPPAARL
jgi:peroxisomal trans-2-enoyl-CoA reductase